MHPSRYQEGKDFEFGGVRFSGETSYFVTYGWRPTTTPKSDLHNLQRFSSALLVHYLLACIPMDASTMPLAVYLFHQRCWPCQHDHLWSRQHASYASGSHATSVERYGIQLLKVELPPMGGILRTLEVITGHDLDLGLGNPADFVGEMASIPEDGAERTE